MSYEPRFERLLRCLLTMKTRSVQGHRVANAELSIGKVAVGFSQPFLREVTVVFHKALCPRVTPWSRWRDWRRPTPRFLRVCEREFLCPRPGGNPIARC